MNRPVYVLLFLGVIFYNNAFAQKDDYLRNEFGYQLNFILNQWVFSKNTTDDLISFNIGKSSLVEYRRFYKPRSAFMIGGSAYFKKNNEVLDERFPGIYRQKKRGYLLRIGLEKYRKISKKGSLYFSTEVLLSHQKFNARINVVFTSGQNSDDFEYTKKQEENEIGIIPKLGFRYQLNDKFSLSINANILISKVFYNHTISNPFFSDPFFSNGR